MYQYQLRFERKNGDIDFAEIPCGKWEWDSELEMRKNWSILMRYIKKRKAVSYFITKAWDNDYDVIWDSNDE